jgi:hypothetical protein
MIDIFNALHNDVKNVIQEIWDWVKSPSMYISKMVTIVQIMELEVVGFVVVSLPDILMFIVKLILFFCYNSMADKCDEILFRLREISSNGKIQNVELMIKLVLS